MIEIKVDITREDYWRFNQFFMTRQFPLKKLNLVILALLAVLFSLAGLITAIEGNLDWASDIPGLPFLVALIGLSVLLLVVTKVVSKRMIKKLPSDTSGTLGERVLQVTEEGIREESSTSSGFHRWEAVVEVTQDSDYIYLFVDRMAAHIVPKRCFKTSPEAQSFAETSLSYWAAARERTNRPPGSTRQP